MTFTPPRPDDPRFMEVALAEARLGLEEGGIPIGAALVIDGRVAGRGHNRRIQLGDPTLHGEMDCLKNAGRLPTVSYSRAVMYTTLSPCDMCSGAILLYRIPRVVMGENCTFRGAEDLLASRGVELVNLDLDEAFRLMEAFIRANPRAWNEDIGV